MPFSVKTLPEDASATSRQRFCRRILAFSKGLAMLIRSATPKAFAGAVPARTIAAAPLSSLSPILGIGLLLLSCP
jgi:hypothetical protein